MAFEQWEYSCCFVYANREGKEAAAYLQQRYPKWSNPPKYTPEAMEGELNSMGKNGWELVHMQPVAGVGSNADVRWGGDLNVYTNAYFCVFKRRIVVTS